MNKLAACSTSIVQESVPCPAGTVLSTGLLSEHSHRLCPLPVQLRMHDERNDGNDAAYPAFYAARLNPADALRYEV